MALHNGDEWQEIADALINKFSVAFSHIEIDKVLFLSETEKTPKDKYADTKFVSYPYNFLTDYKFFIIFYENNIQAMTDEQKKVLCFEQLLHIDESFTKIRKYDVKSFREFISKMGMNWDIDPNLPDILSDEVEGD
ncbi:gp231 [Bacillus phage G]|uniref:Gp231 n=1 Tax=Bacillus phage G TaxID=2884420 RepID=G3M9X2_9CAUD|nr:gp231 [Bacillus phage G]AEO93490.1 gp231 [Bacillus phage G]